MNLEIGNDQRALLNELFGAIVTPRTIEVQTRRLKIIEKALEILNPGLGRASTPHGPEVA